MKGPIIESLLITVTINNYVLVFSIIHVHDTKRIKHGCWFKFDYYISIDYIAANKLF